MLPRLLIVLSCTAGCSSLFDDKQDSMDQVDGTNTPPELVLVSPIEGAGFNEGDNIRFEGTAKDAEDASASLQLTWSSDIDGELGSDSADSTGAFSRTIHTLSPGTHEIAITATDSAGAYATQRVSLTINGLPAIEDLTIAPDPADTTDTLVATVSGVTDAEGDLVTLTYEWFVDGASVPEMTSSTFPSESTSKGHTYRVVVTPSDDGGEGTYQLAELVVSNAAPIIDGPHLSATEVRVGDAILCETTVEDVDPEDTFSFVLSWSNGSTDSEYTVTPDDDPGDAIDCTISATDSDGGASTATATATVINTDPVFASVEISPTEGRVGDALTCTATASDADGDTPTITYAWSDGSTGATLTLTDAHNPGDVLTCTAMATDADAGTASLDATATVLNTEPEISTVTISPTGATNDDTVTCTATSSDADGDTPTVVFTWTNLSSGMVMGTSSALDLSAQPVSSLDTVQCTAAAADPHGGVATLDASIEIANRAPVAAVTLSPSPAVTSDTLTCASTSTDDDDDSLTNTFIWTVSGAVTTATSSTATESVLEGAFSRGDTVDCEVTTDDGKGGSDSATTSTTIQNAPPSITDVLLTPDPAYTEDTLTVSAVISDADGDATTSTWDWVVTGVIVQSGSTTTLDASMFERGDTVQVLVTADDGVDTASGSTSALTISNTPPTTPTIEVSPTAPVEGESMVCSVATDSTDPDTGDTISYTVSWTVDGIEYAAGGSTDTGVDTASTGWTGPSTTTLTDDTVSADDTESGQTWSCTVEATDGYDTTTATASVEVATPCSGCGDGSDGAYTPTTSGSLTSGVYNYTTFEIPSGVTISATSDTPLVIYATESIVIDGDLMARGGSASGTTGGDGVWGGLDGRDGSYQWSYRRNGANGTHPTDYLLCSFTDPSTMTGGTGGGGGNNGRCPSCCCSCNSSADGGGGGGGGGAIALFAPSVQISGNIDVSGGARGYSGCHYGGTGGPGAIWIHASTVDITGTITRGSLTGYSDMRIDAWSYSVPYADYEYCPPIDMPVP